MKKKLSLMISWVLVCQAHSEVLEWPLSPGNFYLMKKASALINQQNNELITELQNRRNINSANANTWTIIYGASNTQLELRLNVSNYIAHYQFLVHNSDKPYFANLTISYQFYYVRQLSSANGNNGNGNCKPKQNKNCTGDFVDPVLVSGSGQPPPDWTGDVLLRCTEAALPSGVAASSLNIMRTDKKQKNANILSLLMGSANFSYSNPYPQYVSATWSGNDYGCPLPS